MFISLPCRQPAAACEANRRVTWKVDLKVKDLPSGRESRLSGPTSKKREIIS